MYYSDDWQVLEEKVGTATRAHYVWSPIYVDALILRDNYNVSGGDFGGGDDDSSDEGGGGEDFGGGGSLSERYYVQQDANWNVTALVDASNASVVERYTYDSYGQPTFLDASWDSRSSSAYDWIYLHQGGRYDAVVNLYNFRNRDLSPSLGRWLQTDPLSYAAGDTNLYRDVFNNPTTHTDPSGLYCGNQCGGGGAGDGGDGGGESGDHTSSGADGDKENNDEKFGPELPSWIPEDEEEKSDDSRPKRPDEDKDIRRNWPRLPYSIGPKNGPPQEEDKKHRVEPGGIDYTCYALFRIPSCGYQGGYNRPPPKVIGPENFDCVPCIPGSTWRFDKIDGDKGFSQYWPPNFVGPLPPRRPDEEDIVLEPDMFFLFHRRETNRFNREGKPFIKVFPKGEFPKDGLPRGYGGFFVSPIWPYVPKTPPAHQR